jgi:MOSC domain-containing protein YiiM
MHHLSSSELAAGLPEIRQSPADNGVLLAIVRRPVTNEREDLAEAELDVELGLVGDRWQSSNADEPDTQITLINSRAIQHIAGSRERWGLAGDQLYVDLDLGAANLPPGTRLQIGTAVLEITAEPHAGCAKFSSRFGADALKFVNSPEGRALKLRGIYAKVVTPGRIRTGDRLQKLA